jgi:hypothetical protein
MKKLFIISFTLLTIGLESCGSGNNTVHKTMDTVSAGAPSIDSAANNSVIPPSANPANAGNSSLADTAYKDSTKSK